MLGDGGWVLRACVWWVIGDGLWVLGDGGWVLRVCVSNGSR